MPITVPNTAAITAAVQAMLNSQKTAIDATVNAARDNVKADTTTQLATQKTAIDATVNAARDNVKADTTAQLATQTTAINSNTDTKTGAVTTAVNAKGVVKSIQRISWNNSASTVTIAAVVPAKTVIVLDAIVQQGGTGTSASASVLNATTIQVSASVSCSAQVVEYF